MIFLYFKACYFESYKCGDDIADLDANYDSGVFLGVHLGVCACKGYSCGDDLYDRDPNFSSSNFFVAYYFALNKSGLLYNLDLVVRFRAFLLILGTLYRVGDAALELVYKVSCGI